MTTVDRRHERIPNNVGLADDRRLQRALEAWRPRFLDWWAELGPDGFQDHDVYLRTAVDVGQDGWANFDYVKMPDYRWGIFLAEAEPDRRIGFGDDQGEPVWQEVPGEHRADAAAARRRAGRHRAGVGRAAAPPRRHRAEPLRPAQPVPDQRRGGSPPLGDGVPAARATSAATGATRPTSCSSGARATTTTPASSARSTSRRPTGCRSSSSPTSPTATASSSSPRWPRRRSTRSPARASSCCGRRRTTCSWARAASGASCSAPSS